MTKVGMYITGTKSYIGRHLIQILHDRFDWPVFGCDLRDGTDFVDVKGMDIDCLVHLAANAVIVGSSKHAGQILETNAFNIITFLQNNQVNKLIFMSTGGAIYGERTTPAKEDEADWLGCISPYAQSKYIAENIIRRIHPNHVILRLGNVFGGDMSGRPQDLALTHFQKDNPITIFGGEQTRDFVHVDIVCGAILRAAESDITGTFNIANGESILLRHLAERHSHERQVPLIIKEHRPEEIVNVSLDVTKAREAHLIPEIKPENDYNS